MMVNAHIQSACSISDSVSLVAILPSVMFLSVSNFSNFENCPYKLIDTGEQLILKAIIHKKINS